LKSDAGCGVEGFAQKYWDVLLSTNPLKAAEAIPTDFDCKNPPAKYVALCAENKAISDKELASWYEGFKMVVAVFNVKPNGKAIDRPSTVLATGKDSGVRAPIGAACLLNKPQGLPSGADIRAQWQGGPDGVVTLCGKVTQ
jgi:hypothetical protein